MSTSIGSVITGSFIELFNKSSKSSNSALASALSGQGSASVDYRTTLQSGASVYSKAIQTISSVGGYVNLAIDTLTELGEITDKLISLAEEATHTTGSSSLRKINRSFQGLVKDFNKLIDNASYNEHDYLALEDLEELFVNVGLNPEKARDLKKIFDNFIIAEKDTNKLLASGATKPTSYSKIPSSAFQTKITKPDEFSASKITETPINTTNQNSIISNINAVTQSTSETSSFSNTITISSLSDSTETVLNFSTETILKTVNPRSGYSIIESSDDLISGQNINGKKQLFLLDEKGTALQQITSINGDVTFGEASISDDGKHVIYAFNDGTQTLIKNTQYSAFGTAPELTSKTTVATLTSDDISTVSSLSMSSDGSYYSFLSKNSTSQTQWDANLINSETLTKDNFLSTKTDITALGFTDTNSLAILSGADANQSISTYTANSNFIKEIASSLNVDNFNTLEKSSFSNGYISYTTTSPEGNKNISILTDSGETVFNENFTEISDVFSISIRNNGQNSASVGVFGTEANSSPAQDELYEYELVNNSRVIKYSSSISRPLNILNGSFKLSSRAAGYVALDDLKAIKEQIDTNLKTLDSSLDYMQKNIDLARATGFALLDVSYEVQTYDDAESLAKKVRKEILKSAPHLLGQVHNLEPIASAAVLYDINNKKK